MRWNWLIMLQTTLSGEGGELRLLWLFCGREEDLKEDGGNEPEMRTKEKTVTLSTTFQNRLNRSSPKRLNNKIFSTHDTENNRHALGSHARH